MKVPDGVVPLIVTVGRIDIEYGMATLPLPPKSPGRVCVPVGFVVAL